MKKIYLLFLTIFFQYFQILSSVNEKFTTYKDDELAKSSCRYNYNKEPLFFNPKIINIFEDNEDEDESSRKTLNLDGQRLYNFDKYDHPNPSFYHKLKYLDHKLGDNKFSEVAKEYLYKIIVSDKDREPYNFKVWDNITKYLLDHKISKFSSNNEWGNIELGHIYDRWHRVIAVQCNIHNKHCTPEKCDFAKYKIYELREKKKIKNLKRMNQAIFDLLELTCYSLHSHIDANAKPYLNIQFGGEAGEEIKNIFEKIDLLQQSNEKCIFIANEQIDISNEQARELKKAQDYADLLERNKNIYNSLAGGFDALSVIANIVGEPQAARQINAFGQGSLRILNSVNEIMAVSSASATGLASTGILAVVNPYLAMAQGIGMIISAFTEDNDESSLEFHQEVMKAIQQLSNQLTEFHKDTIERFNDLEKHLDNHHKSMLCQFFALSQGQENIEDAIKKMASEFKLLQNQAQESINYTNSSIQNNQQQLLDAFRSENLREIDEIIERAKYDVESNIDNNELFERNIQNLYICATKTAKQANITGSSVDPKDYKSLDIALSRSGHSHSFFGHPGLENINLIKNSFADSNFACSPALVNPLVWIRCTDALVDLLNKKLANNPTFLQTESQRQLLLKRLNDIAHEGANIAKFISKLGDGNHLTAIFREYSQSIDDLIGVINGEIKQYEAKRSDEFQSEHLKFIESEKAKIQTIPTIKYDKTLKQAMLSKEMAEFRYIRDHYPNNAYKDGDFQKLKFFCERSYADGFRLRIKAEGNNTNLMMFKNSPSIEDIKVKIKSQEQDNFNDWEDVIEKSTQEYADSFFTSIRVKAISNIIYPETKQPYSVLLRIPDDFKLPQEIVQAEKVGLSEIRLEYKIVNGEFHLLVYVIQNRSKKLITEFIDSFYNISNVTDEDIVNYWNDHIMNMNIFGSEENFADSVTISFDHGYYQHKKYQLALIPKDSYKGKYRNFMQQAKESRAADYNEQIENQFACLNAFQRNETIEFNDQIKNKALAAGSQIFNLLQKLDSQFNILDCLLVLTYNEQYQEHEEFGLIHNQEQLFVNNRQAILDYLSQYGSDARLQAEQYLPKHLENTLNIMALTLESIKSLNLVPEFRSLNRTLSKLNNIMSDYSEALISPAESYIPRSIEYKNSQITELLENNKTLQKNVELMQEQINKTQVQMQNMMQLFEQFIDIKKIKS